MTRLRAATPKVFAHRGRHGDQDGQAEQAAAGECLMTRVKCSFVYRGDAIEIDR